MSQKKLLFGKSKHMTPIFSDITNSFQNIPCTSKDNNSLCSKHILNEEIQSSQLIFSRKQSSLDNFDLNVDHESGFPPPPASPLPSFSPPPDSPKSPSSQKLPDRPQSTDSLQSLDTPQPSVSQLSPVLLSTSEPPNEAFNMVRNQPLPANAYRNQRSLSPNQPVNFKYPKRGYKDSN